MSKFHFDDRQGNPSLELPEEEINLRAISVAPGALTWLQYGRTSRVLHVFKTACNLIDDQGEILSLILDPGQMDPFAIALERPPARDGFAGYLDADSPVRIMPDEIRVGALRVWIDDPVLWTSRPDWGLICAALSRTSGWLSQIEERLLQSRSVDSLAALIGNPDASWQGTRSPWWTKAAVPIKILMYGLASRDERKLGLGAARLAGLGIGLTPSGDDFLIGMMYAIHATLDPREAQALSCVIEKVASPRTGAFPAAYLKVAAQGEAANHWQALLVACVEEEPTGINTALDTLLAVGHTSGEDALAGFLLGIKSLIQA